MITNYVVRIDPDFKFNFIRFYATLQKCYATLHSGTKLNFKFSVFGYYISNRKTTPKSTCPTLKPFHTQVIMVLS
jgi:hypothetical protein